MKMLDIIAMKRMSSAIAEDGYIYVWGACFDQQIRKPITCEYTAIFDMSNALSARPPTSVKFLNADRRGLFFFAALGLHWNCTRTGQYS